MSVSWKARQMVPGRDTISVMAMHYGLQPNEVRDIVRRAGAKVIREDGFKGVLALVQSGGSRKAAGWEDGKVGVDPATTKLTRSAIMAVAQWKFHQGDENGGDN